MSTNQGAYIKEKINIAYSDLEILQLELKKLKNSTLTMNTINEKADRALQSNNINYNSNSSMQMINPKKKEFFTFPPQSDFLKSNNIL